MAMDTLNKMLEIRPFDRSLVIQKKKYANGSLFDAQKLAELELEKGQMEQYENLFNEYKFPRELYEKICRGDVRPTAKQLAPLRCRYDAKRSAFLKIGPLKMEQLSLEPHVALYHDIIFDSEIKLIKSKAKETVGDIGFETANSNISIGPFNYKHNHIYT